MAEIKFDIQTELGVISESAKGWKKELNMISWNGAAAKFDIRDWAPVYYGKNVPLFRRNGYRMSGTMIP